MEKLLTPASLALLTMTLVFTSCDDNKDSYPDEYIGFDKSVQEISYRTDEDRKELSVKIMAIEKSKEDRIIAIDSPQNGSFYEVKDTKVTIKSGKKSTRATIILYPKKVGISRYIHLVCRPQVTKAEATTLSIRLIKE